MIEYLLHKLGIDFISNMAISWTLDGLTTILFLWLMKKIPNGKIKSFFGGVGWRVGVILTLGLSRYKWSKAWWEKAGEPWLIDLIDNTINEFTSMLVMGLRSNNPKPETDETVKKE